MTALAGERMEEEYQWVQQNCGLYATVSVSSVVIPIPIPSAALAVWAGPTSCIVDP